MLLKDRIVLVTGASRGIGAATAKLLAAHGAAVAVNYLQNEKAANAVVDAIEAEEYQRFFESFALLEEASADPPVPVQTRAFVMSMLRPPLHPVPFHLFL